MSIVSSLKKLTFIASTMSLCVGVASTLKASSSSSSSGETPPPKYSSVSVMYQDETVEGFSPTVALFNSKEMDTYSGLGPISGPIKVYWRNRLAPSSTGDYVVKYGTNDFLTTNSFAATKLVFDITGRDIASLFAQYPKNSQVVKAYNAWQNQGGFRSLYIYSNDTSDSNNAYYSRTETGSRSLHFLPMVDLETGKVTGHTANHFDVVAHEGGHAILDILKPEYFETSTLQTGGLHEAFGDLMAMYGVLNNFGACEKLVTATKCDLGRNSFLTGLAEQFGQNFGMKSLRDLSEDVSLVNVEPEVHAISPVFSGAWYDVFVSGLNEFLEEADVLYRENPALAVHQLAAYHRGLLFQGIIEDTTPAGTFLSIGGSIYNAAIHRSTSESVFANLNWDDYILYEYEKRGILGSDAAAAQLRLASAQIALAPGVCASLACKHAKPVKGWTVKDLKKKAKKKSKSGRSLLKSSVLTIEDSSKSSQSSSSSLSQKEKLTTTKVESSDSDEEIEDSDYSSDSFEKVDL